MYVLAANSAIDLSYCRMTPGFQRLIFKGVFWHSENVN